MPEELPSIKRVSIKDTGLSIKLTLKKETSLYFGLFWNKKQLV